MNSIQKAIIVKDVKEVLGSKQMLLPMIIVPLIMMLIMPLVLVVGAKYGISGINGMDFIVKTVGSQLKDLNNSQLLFEIGLNYMFPVLFLIIPIMVSSIIGASSFVGEKEHKTLETLFYTPISIRELFVSKVIGCAVPALAVTLFSSILFGIVMNVGGLIYFEKLVFPNIKWLILIIWVSPSVTLMAIYFMVLISAKANTFQEAQQMSALIIIPVILLLLGQMGGLFILNELILVGLGAVIFVIDFYLMKKTSSKFVPEKLL